MRRMGLKNNGVHVQWYEMTPSSIPEPNTVRLEVEQASRDLSGPLQEAVIGSLLRGAKPRECKLPRSTVWRAQAKVKAKLRAGYTFDPDAPTLAILRDALGRASVVRRPRSA
jgi:hypothetical protein